MDKKERGNTMTKQSKNSRNGSIDLMKFVFTLVIMLFHTNKLFGGGYIAVDFFFVVSGYLMAVSMEKRMSRQGQALVPLGHDTASFLLHKAGGIFPYYVVVFALTFILSTVMDNKGWQEAAVLLFRSPYNLFMLEMAGNYDMGHRIQATWYISAMLLAMLVIYPLRKKKTNFFDYVVAPAAFFIFVGMAYQTKSRSVAGFTVGYVSNLYIYNGLVRGIAEISIGCTCFTVGKKLNELDFTTLGRILISLIEWGGYATILYCAYRYAPSDIDLVLLLIIMISVTLSFSGKGILAPIMNNRMFSWLGTFSLYMYLTHGFVINRLLPFLREETAFSKILNQNQTMFLLVYVAVTVMAAIVCMALGNLLKKVWPSTVRVCKKVLLKANS